MQPYDYAPRLAALARARRRRHLFFTLCVMTLPALSLQWAPSSVAQSLPITEPLALAHHR